MREPPVAPRTNRLRRRCVWLAAFVAFAVIAWLSASYAAARCGAGHDVRRAVSHFFTVITLTAIRSSRSMSLMFSSRAT